MVVRDVALLVNRSQLFRANFNETLCIPHKSSLESNKLDFNEV